MPGLPLQEAPDAHAASRSAAGTWLSAFSVLAFFFAARACVVFNEKHGARGELTGNL